MAEVLLEVERRLCPHQKDRQTCPDICLPEVLAYHHSPVQKSELRTAIGTKWKSAWELAMVEITSKGIVLTSSLV